MAGSDTGFTAPTLIVTGGALDGQSLSLTRAGDTLLGSGPSSALLLQLGNVAGEHARLHWSAQGVLLTDLESPTGTYVNGERISSEHPLADGDRVCLGPPGSKQSVKFLVRLPERSTEEPSFAGAVPADELDLSAPSEQPARASEAPLFDFGGSLEGPAAGEHTPPPPLVLVEPDRDKLTPPVRRGEAEGIMATASDELELPPRPRPAPEPEPVPMPAPRAEAPPPPAAKTEARRAVKPEYTSDMPSIAPDRPREAPSVPAMPAVKLPAPKRQAPRSDAISIGRFELPRVAVLGALGLVALGLVALLARPLLRSAPVLEAIMPGSVFPGATITITGQGFSGSADGNEVRFGDKVGKVDSATGDRLTVSVPDFDLSQGPKDVQVTVRAHGKTSPPRPLRLFVISTIRGLNPDLALPGTEVLVTLGSVPDGPPRVTLHGRPVEVLHSEGRTLRIRVPADLSVPMGTRVAVALESTEKPGPPAYLVIGKLPLLSEVAPRTGQAGTRVALKGRGFSEDAARNVVRFAGVSVAVLHASSTELLVSSPPPPASESQFDAGVTVSVDGTVSNSVVFRETRPSAFVFVPRFFVTQVPSQPQWLFVATELGPVALLADKDDAPSVGERAARLVDALNEAVERTQAGRPAKFELRESPRPGVGLLGGALLLAAAPGDVAAYQAQAKGQQASPRALAAHWAGLLQDFFALFLEHRRPAALAELSPRGRVLIDLFADAQRRAAAGAVGVPRSLLLPLTPNLERDLREMALLLPSGASKAAVAGMSLDGIWTGSMDETGQGRREIQVSLRHQGGKLAGDLSTRSRSLAMGIPLTGVTFDKGTLRFTALIGGAPREFVGTLSGGTLAGNVQTPGGKTALGSFTLDFVK